MPIQKIQKVNDPRLEIDQEKIYISLKGASVNSFQEYPAPSVSPDSVQITCNPPSRNIVVSRLVIKKAKYLITITGTNLGVGALLTEGNYGPRAFPIMSTTNTEQFVIGDDTVTASPVQQYTRALLWFRNGTKNRNGQFSLTPAMLDQFQDYSDGVNTNRNPLGAYGDNPHEQTRGSYVGLKLLTNTNTTATIELEVFEPCLISPLVAGKTSNFMSGLVGIQNMSYTATFTNLTRVLSLVQDQSQPGVVSLNNPVVQLTNFSLLFNYLSPDPMMQIPRTLQLSYFNIVSYPTVYNASIAPGEVKEITMNSIQVTSIPRRVYIYARRPDVAESAFTSDVYFGLPLDVKPLQITWNNEQFLGGASTADLFNISQRNGCEMSYTQWIQDVGSIICLDFGIDIGLHSDQAPSSLGSYQFSVSCQFKNNSSVPIAPSMYVVVVYEGSFMVNNGQTQHFIGNLTAQDVLNAQRSQAITYKDSYSVYGGDFWDSVKSGLSKVHDFAKKHKLVSRGLSYLPDPRAQMASKVARQLGYGAYGGSLKNENNNLSALCESDEENEIISE